MQTLLLGVIPLVFLIALLALAIILQRQTQAAAWWASHSADVLSHSEGIQQAVSDLNGRAVSYRMERSARTLQAYGANRERVVTQTAELERLVADNAAQERRAQAIGAAVNDAVRVLDEFVADLRAGRVRAADALGASPQTQSIAGRLANTRLAFDGAERALAIRRFGTLGAWLGIYGNLVIGFTAIGILGTLLAMARFGVRLAQRLEQLAENARRLGAGENPAPLRGDDEIARIDRVYREMARRLRQERRVARTLQRALLPQELPTFEGVSVSTAYSPAAEGTEIGGDWYDAFAISDDLLAIGVGDVAGSGLKAATIMGAVRQATRTAARENPDPAGVLRSVNRMTCAEGWLVTAFFGIIDVRDGSLFYANAGHPPPFVCEDEGTVPLDCTGLILGVDPDARFSTCEYRLQEGSMLVLFTDGMIEAERDVIKGLADLEKIAEDPAVRSAPSPARLIQRKVFERIRPHDDSAILALRVLHLGTASQRKLEWTFDARDAEQSHRVRAEMMAFITGQSPAADFSVAELIFGELAGNVARHTPGPAQFAVERRDGLIVLEISDYGRAFAYEHHAIDPFAENGRGLFLVHELASGVRIERNGDRNTVTVSLQA